MKDSTLLIILGAGAVGAYFLFGRRGTAAAPVQTAPLSNGRGLELNTPWGSLGNWSLPSRLPSFVPMLGGQETASIGTAAAGIGSGLASVLNAIGSLSRSATQSATGYVDTYNPAWEGDDFFNVYTPGYWDNSLTTSYDLGAGYGF